jgi:glucose uptake protein
MFIVTSLALAIAFCMITMLGWGSWANTQKLAGKEQWHFPLFYWDYAIGVFFAGLVAMLTLGTMGSAGMDAWTNWSQASSASLGAAVLSGVLFNISNLLLVVAIDAAGMSVAFPVGVGLALVIGTVQSYLQTPKGSALLLGSGVILVVFAMIMSALAHNKLPRAAGHGRSKGLIFAIIAGCLMGLFYPQLMRAISPDFNTAPIAMGLLTPYTALCAFGAGLLLSNFIVNTIFMKTEGATYATYFRGSTRLHSLGLLGGIIWMVALICNVVASGVAGPAISYALGQGATLVAAIWGIFIWKEFRDAPAGTMPFVVLMFIGYASGLVLIGLATL